MPIPTIPEVLDRLVAGACTRDQARVWIELHIGEAVLIGCDRDSAARAAMQMLMADQDFRQDVINKGKNMPRAVAAEAYAYADAMKTARGS